MSEDWRDQSQRDLDASPSGYGHDHYEPTPTSFCPDGVPLEFALLSLLAAFGAAFGILYVALTQAGRRRRKRSGETGETAGGSFLVFNTELADLLWTGRQPASPASLKLCIAGRSPIKSIRNSHNFLINQ